VVGSASQGTGIEVIRVQAAGIKKPGLCPIFELMINSTPLIHVAGAVCIFRNWPRGKYYNPTVAAKQLPLRDEMESDESQRLWGE
jgi:hypothetical protein